MRLQPTIQRLFGIGSLRGRYRIVAAAMMLLVVVGVWFAESYVWEVGRDTTLNMSSRNEAMLLGRHVRNEVLEAEFALQSFMISPDGDVRNSVHRHLNAALANSQRFARTPWARGASISLLTKELTLNLERLNDLVDRLMALRSDPEQLFPAMQVMGGVMEPAANNFSAAAALALEELKSRPSDPAYREFHEARHQWSRLISTLRIYLINITGAFGEVVAERQREQEEQVHFLHRQALDHLAKLQALEEQGRLGIEASAALAEMVRAAEEWGRGFDEATRIYSGAHWRTDAPLMQESVQPLFAAVQHDLQAIDQAVERSAAEDVTALTRVAGGVTHTLWALIAATIASFLIAYLYFERSVLGPIALVAQALKEEARGTGRSELPQVDAEETRDLVSAFEAMRKQVHLRQNQLEEQANQDALTGLPNRTRLMVLLKETLDRAGAAGEPVALLVMDLNRFKEINDTLGHEIGDQLLQQVRTRLLRTVDDGETVVRLGGDEFALLLPGTGREQALERASTIGEALGRIFTVEMHTLFVGGGIGIALFPEHGEDARSLIQHAEVAMYIAKRQNHGYVVYDAELDRHSIRRLALESDLHHAISGGQLELYYQPKLALRTGQTLGVEALIRWQHPERGFIAPDELIAAAEQTGLIKPLTAWVIDTALGQCARWRPLGIDIQVAVNLSVWNLQDPELVEQVRAGLERHALPPSSLGLEITESAMMADPDRALNTLVELDSMGISLAVDDFGTGFSSLAYLKRLPVDELKIDKSFVMDMANDENDAAIVRSTIDLAHNLGLKVVAEGVETLQIWTMLDLLGCDTAQGYYMSRPLPARQFEGWFAENLALHPEARRRKA